MTDLFEELALRGLEHDRVSANLAEAEGDLLAALAELGHVEAARDIHQEVAAACQEAAHGRIAAVVTEALRAVFGEDAYEFRIAFDRKRGKTEARAAFVRGGEEVDPLTASGGGAVDIAALALRVAALVLGRPRKRLFLCLDEPISHLSREYREAAADLLLSLSRRTGIQFLVVTHLRELAIGKVIEL